MGEYDWSKEKTPKEHDPYLNKAIEIAKDGYNRIVLTNKSLRSKMIRLAVAKPNSMLNNLIKIVDPEELAKAEEAEAADPAEAEAALLKQLQDWYEPLAEQKKHYYIHRSHGMIWNQQQPFGGFSLEGVVPDYLDKVK